MVKVAFVILIFISLLKNSFFFSFHRNNREEVCSNWILLNFYDIGIPLLTFIGFSCMILRSNGKDLYREIWFPFLLKHTSIEINQAL